MTSSMQRSPHVLIIYSHGNMPVVDITAEDESAFKLPVVGKAPSKPPSKAPSKGRAKKVAEVAEVAEVAQSLVDAVYGKIRPKKVADVKSLVDTFTTAKFGCAMYTDVRQDSPPVDFIQSLIKHVRETQCDGTKDQLRDMIRMSLCEARHRQHEAMVHHPDTCKFKCHRKGKKITEINLFGSGEPVIEGIVSLDPKTGNIEDVISHFGIIEKDGRETPVPEHGGMSAEESAQYIAFFQDLKSRAESELASMQAESLSMPKHDENHSRLMHSIHLKTERIKNLDTLMRSMNRESKFEYSSDMKREYGDVIKLSHLIKTGIDKHLINPTTDFVVVFACRVPDGELPFYSKSPRAGDETPSVGGGRKKSKKCNSKKSKKYNSKKSKKSKKRST